MSDEPPDYIDWGDTRSGAGSFFGCVGMAIGLLFMLTGGLCVWSGFTGSGVKVLLIGLLIAACGWLLTRGNR
jgi:hypothetical protein